MLWRIGEQRDFKWNGKVNCKTGVTMGIIAQRDYIRTLRGPLTALSMVAIAITTTTAAQPWAFASQSRKVPTATKSASPAGVLLSSVTQQPGIHTVKLANLPYLPPNFGDPVAPPLHPSTMQLSRIRASKQALRSPKVQRDIRHALYKLPHLTVGPNSSAYETTYSRRIYDCRRSAKSFCRRSSFDLHNQLEPIRRVWAPLSYDLL